MIDFDWENGGTLLIGAEEIAYTVDPDASQLLLGSGLASPYSAGKGVYLVPKTTERWAGVLAEDQEEELSARVPHALYDRIREGSRDQDSTEAEVVEVDLDSSGDLVVQDVLGTEPANDIGYLSGIELNSGTVDIDTQASPVALSDGVLHGLSDTPTTVVATASYQAGRGSSRVNVTVGALDADSFHVRLRTTDGSNLNTPSGGAFVRVHWLAVLTEGLMGRPRFTGGSIMAITSSIIID